MDPGMSTGWPVFRQRSARSGSPGPKARVALAVNDAGNASVLLELRDVP
jgi:hypothetical protein